MKGFNVYMQETAPRGFFSDEEIAKAKREAYREAKFILKAYHVKYAAWKRIHDAETDAAERYEHSHHEPYNPKDVWLRGYLYGKYPALIAA